MGITEYEEYARDCVRLAWRTQDIRIRGQLLELARIWMALAMPHDKTAAKQRRRSPDQQPQSRGGAL